MQTFVSNHDSKGGRAARHHWQACKRKAHLAVEAAENNDIVVDLLVVFKELDSYEECFKSSDFLLAGVHKTLDRSIVPDFGLQ